MSFIIHSGEWKGQYGTSWKADIIDTSISSGTLATITVMSGFSIDYDNQNTDVKNQPILKSSVSLPILNKGIGSFLSDMTTAVEGRYLLKIYKDSSFFWAGIILQDFGSVEDIDTEVISLTATDGLALLKNIDMDMSAFTHPRVIEMIQKGLSVMSHVDDIWGATDNFLYASTNWRTTKQVNPYTLRYTYINPEVFKDYKEVETSRGETITEITTKSWYDVIETILLHFNARLMLVDGVWNIVQYEIFNMSSNDGLMYKKTTGYTKVNKTFKAAITQSTIARSGGNFNYLPGLKKVRLKYINNDGGNQMPTEIEINTNYSLRPVIAGTGNFLAISGFISLVATIPQTFEGYAYYQLEIKVGSYYYADNSWSTTAQTYELRTNYIPTKAVSGTRNIRNDVTFDFNTLDIPADGTLSIKVTYDTSKGLGAESGVTNLGHNIETLAATYIIGNDESPNYIKFEARNSSDFSLISEIEDTLFGMAGTAANLGSIKIDDVADIKNYIQDLKEEIKDMDVYLKDFEGDK